MTTEGGSDREEDGAFARAVIDLFKENIGQRAEKKHRDNKKLQDAVRCANGLALIQQLLSRHLQEIWVDRLREVAADPLAFNETVARSGIAEAFGIVEHLTTGLDHPIARHIRGIPFATLRMNRARVNDFALLCQRIAVGAALAIEADEGVSFRRAARKLAEALAGQALALRLGEESLKAWRRKFTQADDKGPEAFSAHIAERVAMLRQAGFPEVSAFEVGARMFQEMTLIATGEPV